MKATKNLKTVHLKSSNDSITSFAGLKFIFDVAQKLDIPRLLSCLEVKKRKRGIPVEDLIMSLVSNFVVGGDTYSDIHVLRDETATQKLNYDLKVPAATTVGEYLRKFHIGHLKQLQNIQKQALHKVESVAGGNATATLDIDSSILESYSHSKEGVEYTYKKCRGFHPLLCFWQENRSLLNVRLRSGGTYTSNKATSFIGECLAMLPLNIKTRVRMDAGFYDKNIVSYLDDRQIDFTISCKRTNKLTQAILDIPEDKWKEYQWDDNTEWAELIYQPTHWEKPYRILVKRNRYYEDGQLVIGKFFYKAVITNRRGAGSSLLKFHFARGGAENYIEEFKNGFGARLLPNENFMANQIWLTIAQLAYNLCQWFKIICLPKKERHYQIKKLRLLWINVGARLVCSGRRVLLYLSRPPDKLPQWENFFLKIAAI